VPVLSEKEKGNVYQVFYIGYFIPGNGREKEKLYRMYFIIKYRVDLGKNYIIY